MKCEYLRARPYCVVTPSLPSIMAAQLRHVTSCKIGGFCSSANQYSHCFKTSLDQDATDFHKIMGIPGCATLQTSIRISVKQELFIDTGLHTILLFLWLNVLNLRKGMCTAWNLKTPQCYWTHRQGDRSAWEPHLAPRAGTRYRWTTGQFP